MWLGERPDEPKAGGAIWNQDHLEIVLIDPAAVAGWFGVLHWDILYVICVKTNQC